MEHEQTSISDTVGQKRPVDVSKPKIKVLLVEDDDSVRRYLEVVLQRSGYQVICAADGLAAMKLALVLPIDVVVTDAIMPQLDGQQLAQFLRNNEKLSRVPIVMLTARNRDAAGVEDSPVDAFLAKPVKPDELMSCLERLLKERRPINS